VLAPGISAGDHLISWDVAYAYHHLRLRPEAQLYLAFTILARFFVPVPMLFGSSVASFIETKVCRPVVARLREFGVRLTAYVDDFGGPSSCTLGDAATSADARAGLKQAKELFSSLHLRVHKNKGEREGTTELPLLGNVVDTRRSSTGCSPIGWRRSRRWWRR